MSGSEIEIALWPRGSRAEQHFPAFLQRYTQHNKMVRVKPVWMDMQNPWVDVNRAMIQKSGPDITELGASWVESLVATHNLRPFSQDEFASFGGPKAFIMPAWKKLGDAEPAYSIPHTTDARHIYYRRDILASAGINESTAFITAQNVLQTLETLKRAGVKSPLVAPITSQRMNLSFIASWVWGAGADFIDGTGTRATFDSPEAVAAMADYFRAVEYIAPELRELAVEATDKMFALGNAAVAFSGSWLYHLIQQLPEYAHVKENLGLALPAGQACCGGTHLVIWQHCVQEEAAFDFIRFLSSPQVQADFSVLNFVMPARLESSQLTPYAHDPNYEMLVKTILSGRSYGASPFWNIVEERLSRTIVQLWSEYFDTQGVDTNAFLATRLEPLARRINITMED